MTNRQLAILVLICTRTVVDVIVGCVGGPGSKADMHRIAKTRAMFDDYIRLLQIDDVETLKSALDDVDA